jgi:hypothetical protein
MMTPPEFEKKLAALLDREPFQPFIVEYDHGERFEVAEPYVSRSGGSAGYITADQKLYLFDCQNVRQFLLTPSEARA